MVSPLLPLGDTKRGVEGVREGAFPRPSSRKKLTVSGPAVQLGVPEISAHLPRRVAWSKQCKGRPRSRSLAACRDSPGLTVAADEGDDQGQEENRAEPSQRRPDVESTVEFQASVIHWRHRRHRHLGAGPGLPPHPTAGHVSRLRGCFPTLAQLSALPPGSRLSVAPLARPCLRIGLPPHLQGHLPAGTPLGAGSPAEARWCAPASGVAARASWWASLRGQQSTVGPDWGSEREPFPRSALGTLPPGAPEKQQTVARASLALQAGEVGRPPRGSAPASWPARSPAGSRAPQGALRRLRRGAGAAPLHQPLRAQSFVGLGC